MLLSSFQLSLNEVGQPATFAILGCCMLWLDASIFGCLLVCNYPGLLLCMYFSMVYCRPHHLYQLVGESSPRD